MEIKYRMDILKEAGQISQLTYERVEKIIDHFLSEHLIEIDETNGAMLITHLCIALSRMEKGEKINKIEEEMFEEVRKNKFFMKAQEAMEEINKILGSEMPIEESGYMMMHLCVLFEKTVQA